MFRLNCLRQLLLSANRYLRRQGDILYSFCQEKKVRKNKIFKNNELKIDPLFGNTSPSDSVHGFVFDFDEFLANNEL